MTSRPSRRLRSGPNRYVARAQQWAKIWGLQMIHSMKIFSDAISYSKLLPKIYSAVCVFLLMMLFTLRYLSSNILDRRHYPEFNGGSFLIRPNSKCDVSHPFLVILVCSAQDEFKARSAIRQTWGGERMLHGKRVVVYFLLGYNQEHQEHLLEEGLLHKDIIQKEFSDTYYNLTTKVLMGLEWVNRYCPSTSFVMKTDSDMFVNIYNLIELLSQTSHRNIYTGYIWEHSRPMRDKSSKWYVSKQEYPLEWYPPFCSGTGYVLSTDIACCVWNISNSIPKLKLEDVFVGLCLAEMKIAPVKINSSKTFHISKVQFSVCAYRKLVTSHKVKPYELLIYWRALADAGTEGCPGDL
uniref:beta-1,3-galactosyltransferase 5-like n=1 Tax=Pristiophorus japonicus TaxID=55135 RepID=UPI00398E645D